MGDLPRIGKHQDESNEVSQAQPPCLIIAPNRFLPGDYVLLSIIQAAGWPIIPLVACSILMLALIIERFMSLQTRKITPPRLLEEAITVSRMTVPGADVVMQLEHNSVLGEVLASGFRALTSNPRCTEEELRASMEGTGRMVAHRLERYLPALGTIASAAPLLGLLGTVIGMIEIFGAQAPSGGGAGGNPAQLAHGISVALYNTAFGLIVAIPALIFWRYFRARVDGYLLTLELSADRFARHLVGMRNINTEAPGRDPAKAGHTR
ncbi:MAG: putative biopolymer transport protein [Pseudomonadota bacterium]